MPPPNLQRANSPPLAASCALACAVLAWSAARAFTNSTIAIDDIAGEGWTAQGLEARIDLAADPIAARLTIKRVAIETLGTGERVIRDLRIDCADVDLKETILCDRARIVGVFPAIGAQTIAGRAQFNRRTHALSLELRDLKVADATAHVFANWRSGAWMARLQLQNGDIAKLPALLRDWIALPDVDATGKTDLDINARGTAAALAQVDWRVSARQLTLANASGTLASDKLNFNSEGSLQRRSSTEWAFRADVRSMSGQAYAESVFLNLSTNPLKASAQGVLHTRDSRLTMQSFSLEHEKAIAASGRLQVAFGDAVQLEQLHLEVARAELPNAYAIYLQPFLVNSALGSLTTHGTLRGTVDVVDGVPAAFALDIQNVSATDKQNRFALTGLAGAVHWRKSRDERQRASTLNWQHANVLGLDIGAAIVHFTAVDRDFALTETAQIPILDGGVDIANLNVHHAGADDMTVRLDATLHPISVQRLCAAFGWPPFGGSVSGRLADVQLRNGVVTLGTTLQADVFDGRVSISDLRLEQPFSKWPRFSASIAIDRVDLQQVTSAFSFGAITGRLSGEIDHLQLFNWSPVAFDARLYTPADDESRHRISQRAVKNIGSLGGSGGGVAAVLSSGFLRFFENFNYDRIGISCRLENEVCYMNGVEPAPNGYYLVKGRGLPRIDVIGNARRVDWPRLVSQLRAATESQSLEVK